MLKESGGAVFSIFPHFFQTFGRIADKKCLQVSFLATNLLKSV